MTTAAGHDRNALEWRAHGLAYATIVWNTLEAVIAIASGVATDGVPGRERGLSGTCVRGVI